LGRAVKTRHIPTTFESGTNRSLFMMSAALGEKDSYTYAHAQRVAAYTRRLAQRMGFSRAEIHQFTLGGMLHDLGKIALSDRIFSSTQLAMSKEMLTEVYSHPLIGAALLRNLECSSTIAEIVLYHHERMDGSGYPFGLKGDEIPFSAKLVSVVDCFDAITTDRPYQRRKTREHAFSILRRMSGTAMPEELIDHMIAEIRSGGMEPIMPASGAQAFQFGSSFSH
jgi:putative nucleotidyltransferase with HDIG domain